MAIEKVIDIKIQGNADEAVGSLRSQLRAAQADVAALSEKFGVTSQEAIQAAKRAGELKDQIGDAKALTDAFNPDAKFKALSSSLAGVAGGFAVVQGGMALLGTESKDVEKTLLKVQAAMALSQGLQTIGESVDSFKQLGAVAKSYSVVQKVITAAQWLWNAAMAANPIGAIVVAITALIAGGYALVKMFRDSTAANEAAMASTKAHTKELENQAKEAKKSSDNLKDHNGHLYDMAKAAGASAEELRKLALKHADEEVSLAKNNATIAANTFNRERNTLATLKAAGASDEVIAAQQKLTNESYKEFKEQDKILVESYKNRKEVVQKNEVEILQEKTNATTKDNDDSKTKREQKRKETEAQDKKDLEALKAALQAQKDARNANELEITKAIDEAKDKNAESLMTAEDVEIRAVNDKYFKLIELAKEQKRSKEDIDALEIAQMNEVNDIKIKSQNQHYADKKALDDEETANKKANADAQEEIDKKKAQARAQWLSAGANTLKQASQLLGESTDAGKAAAIAAATIETYQAAVSSYNSLSGIPIVGPALGAVAAGVAVASGIANVKKILAVKTPKGGGGGAAPSVAGAGAAGAGSAPQFNVVGNSGVNQLAGIMATNEQTPVKAYVVPSDVTTGQSLDRNIIRNASLG
jgi:hypothetical protein